MPKKKRKPTVRGPQLKLKMRGLGRAKGDPGTGGRTPRLRYVEPPHKPTGNPFVAFRAPRELRSAFDRWCKKKKTSMPEAFRAYMGKVTGMKVDAGSEA